MAISSGLRSSKGTSWALRSSASASEACIASASRSRSSAPQAIKRMSQWTSPVWRLLRQGTGAQRQQRQDASGRLLCACCCRRSNSAMAALHPAWCHPGCTLHGATRPAAHPQTPRCRQARTAPLLPTPRDRRWHTAPLSPAAHAPPCTPGQQEVLSGRSGPGARHMQAWAAGSQSEKPEETTASVISVPTLPPTHTPVCGGSCLLEQAERRCTAVHGGRLQLHLCLAASSALPTPSLQLH